MLASGLPTLEAVSRVATSSSVLLLLALLTPLGLLILLVLWILLSLLVLLVTAPSTLPSAALIWSSGWVSLRRFQSALLL